MSHLFASVLIGSSLLAQANQATGVTADQQRQSGGDDESEGNEKHGVNYGARVVKNQAWSGKQQQRREA